MDHADASLRMHLLKLLDSPQAHRTFDDVIRDLPPALRSERPDGLPYSPWELLEHLRLAQRDILDFCRDPAYEAPVWPEDYWPETSAPPDEQAWNTSIRRFRTDLDAMKQLVRETNDLYGEIPHGDGQSYLREALLVADHNAYHLGQLVTVRRLLGAWPPE